MYLLKRIDRNRDKGQLNINISLNNIARNEPMNKSKLYEKKYKLNKIFTALIQTDKQLSIEVLVQMMDHLTKFITLSLCYSGIPIRDICFSI